MKGCAPSGSTGGEEADAVALYQAVTGEACVSAARAAVRAAGGDANAAANAFFAAAHHSSVTSRAALRRGAGGELLVAATGHGRKEEGLRADHAATAEARGAGHARSSAEGKRVETADAGASGSCALQLPPSAVAVGWAPLLESGADIEAQCAADSARNDGVLAALGASELYSDPGFAADAASIDGAVAEGAPPPPKCRCGAEALCKRVSKDGPTQGRLFYCCAKGRANEGGCGYFHWAPKGAAPSGRGRKSAERAWRRCGPPMFRLSGPGGPKAEDVRQGSVGDCWFVSVLSTLATRPELVRRLLPLPGAAATRGAHRVRLFIDGRWRELLLDNRLPCRADAQGHALAYAKAAGAEADMLWVAMLEKAYASAHGSYRAISGGWMAEAFLDLTGCACESLWFSEEAVDLRLTWARLLSWQEAGYLMALATGAGGKELRKKGLVGGHAYSIIRVCEEADAKPAKQTTLQSFFASVPSPAKKKRRTGGGDGGPSGSQAAVIDLTGTSSDEDCVVVAASAPASRSDAELALALQREEEGLDPAAVAETASRAIFDDGVLRLVAIRNPHGKGNGWAGEFGRRSTAWSDKLREKLGGPSARRSDGSFWMRFEDVVRYFELIDVCMAPKGTFHTASFEFTIPRGRTCTGALLELRTLGGARAPVQLAIVQPTKRSRSEEHYWYAPAGLLSTGVEVAPRGADRVSTHCVMAGASAVRVTPFSLHSQQAGDVSLVLRVVSPVPLAARRTGGDAALCEAFARAACGTAVKRHFLGEGSMLACVGGALEGEAVLVAINTSDRVLLGLRLYMTAKRGAVARGPGTRQPVQSDEDGAWLVELAPGTCRVLASAASTNTWEWCYDYRFERVAPGALRTPRPFPAPGGDRCWSTHAATEDARELVACAEAARNFRPEVRGGFRRGRVGKRCVA